MVSRVFSEDLGHSEAIRGKGGSAQVMSSPASGETLALAGDETGDWVGLFVGSGGNVKVDFANSGTGIVLASVPTGAFLPIHVTKVYAVGTTAALIVALS